MSTKVEIPAMGESITEAVIVQWLKADGDQVAEDEPICELETDKATFDLPAPAAGVLHAMKHEGDTVRVGETIAQIDQAPAPTTPTRRQQPAEKRAAKDEAAPPDSQRSSTAATPTDETREPERPKPTRGGTSRPPREKVEPEQPAAKKPSIAVTEVPVPDEELREEPPGAATRERQMHRVAGPGLEQPRAEARPEDRDTEQAPDDAAATLERDTTPKPRPAQAKPDAAPVHFDTEGIRRVPMSRIRRRIAERLVRAQHTAAMLTTFNEIDMTSVLDLRARHQTRFTEIHGVPLGLMSFFARACVLALEAFPVLNAEIDQDDIIYHQHVHLSIAVSTDRGLVVPVLRNVERMSFAGIEGAIKRVATAARDGKLGIEELSGGTFTITNGGVFGSLLSTPILNPPQTGILGMHKIQKRPTVVDDRIEARPMMFVALTYDHRLVDGKDAVSFLVRIKELLEDPARMILQI